jgi:hypothetical protein
MSKRKRKPGDSSRRRSDQFKAGRGGGVSVLVTDCPGCRLCELLGRDLTIPVSGWLVGDDGPPYSEEPGATNSGPSFDQTPSLTWSDLPWKV